MGMAMGGAMGQQMAGMMNGMNQAMQQSTMPQQQMQGTPTPPPMPGAVNYMIAVNGQQYGPYNMQQLNKWWQQDSLLHKLMCGVKVWQIGN